MNELILDGEMIGPPDTLVNDINLQELVDSHLSRNNPQNFSEPIQFDTVVLRNGFDVNYINGFDFKQSVNILKGLRTKEEILKDPSVEVEQMVINGSVWFKGINGQDIEEMKQNAIYLDQPNVIDLPIVFLDPIYVNGNMNVVELNGENFNDLVNDLVRKSANMTRIYGTTIFEEDVTVLQDADFTTINELQVTSILTKNYKGPILNPIQIVGNVYVPNLIVKGSLDGASAEQLNSYSYDDSTGTFFLNKNVYFNDSLYVTYLDMHGSYNDIGNVNQHIKNLIRTDRPAVIKGTVRFTDSVHFENDIDINEFDGVDLAQFMSGVVYVNQYEPAEIYSDIIFDAPVKMPHVRITGDMITEAINNCSVAEWIQDSIRTDEPLNYDGKMVFPPGTFEATNINTQFINGKSMDEVLTLNTPQNFSDTIHFSDVYSNIPIETYGLVSGYDLKQERANTLMVSDFKLFHLKNTFQN